MFEYRYFQRTRKIAWTAMLFACSIANAQNDVCVSSIGGLAGVPNTSDGVVTGDPGWNNAVQLNLSGDLGASTATKAFLGSDGSFLYFGLTVSAPAVDQYDRVILGFSPSDGATADDWRLIIQPFDVAPPPDGSTSRPPFAVTYWRDSSCWNTGCNTVTANPGDWEIANLRVSKLNSGHWELEFKIPIVNAGASTAGFCLSCGGAGTFQLYVNVLDAVGNIASVSEDVWPPCQPGTTTQTCASYIHSGFITQNTPKPSTPFAWGTGSSTPRSACTGVSLAAYTSPLQVGIVPTSNLAAPLTSSIGADLNDVTETSLAKCPAQDNYVPPGPFNSPSNTFVAIPSNNMTNPAQVSVTFRLADFGIPGVDPSLGGSGLFPPLGNPVPAGCDPTQAPFTQCAGVSNNPTIQTQIDAFGVDTPGQPSTKTFNFTTWSLNYKQTCLYKYAFIYLGKPHQCVQAEMDSKDPNTRFLNRSVQQNLDFVQASTFRQSAVINGRQGNVPSPTHFLLQLDLDEQRPCEEGRGNLPGSTKAVASTVGTGTRCRYLREQQLARLARMQLGSDVDNLFQWIVRGFVYTGNKIVIDNKEFEVVRRAGDFGYVAGHAGQISGWTVKFTGDGLGPAGPNLYTLDVDPDKPKTVQTTITANPPGKLAAFFDLGGAIPTGGPITAFNKGFSLNAGLEYMIKPYDPKAKFGFSAEGIFGYHHFPASVGSALDIYQFSGNGKVYFPFPHWPKLRLFVNAGGGGYKLSPGSTYGGINVGGGVLWEQNAHWGFQLSNNFHTVFTPNPSPINRTKFDTLQVGVRYVF